MKHIEKKYTNYTNLLNRRKLETSMCGIVGYIGNQDAKEILLHGLETLEYRGYDSAGIYVTDTDKEGHLFKEKGRIAALRDHVDDSVDATSGIGHTRWATHGQPTPDNAHPHQSASGRFTLVHNGVIENFNQLKTEFLSDVTFKSETDTEVIVQLIGKFAEDGKDTLEAFKKTVSLLKGSYALALVDSENPDTLYAAKNKSPLLLGTGEGFNVISSDAMAMIKETNQFIELHDGEIAEVTRDAYSIQKIDGTTIYRDPYTAEIDANDLSRGTYDHYMLKEMDEQPSVIRHILQEYFNEDHSIKIDESLLEKIEGSDRIYIIAAGTSYHAGFIGKQLIEQIAKIPVEVHVASEFAYNTPLLSDNPYFIYISQSGETADSRQVLVQTNEAGYPSMTLTNVKGSTLSRESDDTLLLYAGPEIAVASTKAYTANIAVLAILATALAERKGLEAPFDIQHELSIVANAIQQVIDDSSIFDELSKEKIMHSRNAFYLGRGIDYYVSMEAALKLKEISYIQTEGWASGELKHGTIALIEDGVPVISLITDEKTALLTRSNAHEVISRGANSIIISMEGLNEDEDTYVLPHIHRLLTPLVSVVPTQLISYYTSLHLGNDIDKPRNLAKSVTVE